MVGGLSHPHPGATQAIPTRGPSGRRRARVRLTAGQDAPVGGVWRAPAGTFWVLQLGATQIRGRLRATAHAVVIVDEPSPVTRSELGRLTAIFGAMVLAVVAFPGNRNRVADRLGCGVTLGPLGAAETAGDHADHDDGRDHAGMPAADTELDWVQVVDATPGCWSNRSCSSSASAGSSSRGSCGAGCSGRARRPQCLGQTIETGQRLWEVLPKQPVRRFYVCQAAPGSSLRRMAASIRR